MLSITDFSPAAHMLSLSLPTPAPPKIPTSQPSQLINLKHIQRLPHHPPLTTLLYLLNQLPQVPLRIQIQPTQTPRPRLRRQTHERPTRQARTTPSILHRLLDATRHLALHARLEGKMATIDLGFWVVEMRGDEARVHDVAVDALGQYFVVEAVVEADYRALRHRGGGCEGDVFGAGEEGGADYCAVGAGEHVGEHGVDEGYWGAEIRFQAGPPVGEEVGDVREGGEGLA
jgi:hypothetical protein